MAKTVSKTYTTTNMNGSVVANWKQSAIRTDLIVYGVSATALDYDINYRPHKVSFYNNTGQNIEILIINNAEEEALYDAETTYAGTAAAIGWTLIPAGVFVEDSDNPIWAFAVKKEQGGTDTTGNLRVDFKNFGPV